MYARIVFTLFAVFAGIVHANTVNHLPGLLRPRSEHAIMPRRPFNVKPLQELTTRSSRIAGGLLARQNGCQTGYSPCLGDPESCCPPDCLDCGDGTATCCDVGTFCSTDSSGQPSCECFGSSRPDGSGGSTLTTSSFASATGASGGSSTNGGSVIFIPRLPLAFGVGAVAFMLCA